jgi:protein gp37
MLTPLLILVARKREAGARVIALGATSLGGVHKVKEGRRLYGRTYDEMPAL